jgi:UDP-glucose 4-epimerase
VTTPDSKVLVTGANGFVGRALCAALVTSGHGVRMAVRTPQPALPGAVAVNDMGPATDWGAAFDGARCVVHLAARTHVLRETAPDPLAEFRRINVDGTERLARAAAAHGVRRFVFLSSVKVNGESTAARPFTEDDAPRPQDAYGISKLEAEQTLARVAAGTALEVVILRLPLVYGPGVKGNFLRLMDIVTRGVPLPLASVVNRRSLIYVGNLVDAITNAIDTPQAAGQIYLVSDGEDVSTPELVREIARTLEVKPRLFPCPPLVLKIAGMLSGRDAEVTRLVGSLQVDSSRMRRELGWEPRFRLEQGLSETARWYYSRLGA